LVQFLIFILCEYLYRKLYFNRFLNKLVFLPIFEIYISNNKKLLKKETKFMAKNANHISHKKSKQIVEGRPKLPLASDLVEGEIAINFGKDVETISIKNESGDVVTFSSDNYFINEKGGFKRETNPSADTKVGLVNSLSQYYDTNIGKGAVIEGDGNENNNIVASGDYSHAEGGGTKANGNYSHAEGAGTIASGNFSHAEGGGTKANGNYSHAEGTGTIASGNFSHAEGVGTTVSGDYSHAEGQSTSASGYTSHAEGFNTKASGNYSHAEGYGATASGYTSHAEGSNTTASGNYSHAEGQSTSASGNYSHAEGNSTTASGDYSHAEGQSTSASGYTSHAEGGNTTASGNYSHAEGNSTTANGHSSHAEGLNTKANNKSEHASGQYNVSSSASTTFGNSGNTLFSVGNGTGNNTRHNAFEIRQNGDIYISSGGTDILLQDNLGGVVDQVIDSGTSASTNAVATKAVYDVITDNELVWTNAYVAMSGIVSSHTENTEIHVTAADKEKLHTHSNKASLDSITGNVGTMAYEAASSYSSATEVNTALRNKANTSDIANFFDNAKYEDSGSTKVINFYHGNTIKATIDASNFIKDGMVDDVRIENGNLVIDFNTDTGKQDISIPLTDIFDPSNYYNKTAIDNLVGSGFTSSSITDVIIENEEIIASALNNLEERKLDASAYTPTDLSNYYTKSETSGATQISNALGSKVNSATYTAHTADTSLHFSGNEKRNLDSLATNIAAISGITATKVSNWDGAATNSHSHTNKTALDSITGNVGTMAYESASSYSSATEVNTALSNKVDKTEYATFSAATNTSIEDLSDQSETVAAALNDLNTNKADKSTTYTKSEIDNMIGDIETLLAAI